jgi:nucleotide-binding universal stress UspA family protein
MSWPPSRILVATDFSPSARAALEVTADLGRRSGAEIDVVHAVRDPGQLITGYEVIDELLLGRADPRKLRNEARDRLEAAAKEAALRNAKLHVVLGDPAAEVGALRSTLGAELAVLGAGHVRGLRHLLLGSVADRMLRKPGCPLLLVRRVPPGGAFRRVLVGAEWTDRAEPPLSLAAEMMRDLPADLLVLHVLPPPGYLSEEHRLVIEPEREAGRLSETVRKLCPDVGATVTLRRGDPAYSIPEVARELEADLVVVGAHRQQDGWPGRVTDRVARADLPALLVVWPPE